MRVKKLNSHQDRLKDEKVNLLLKSLMAFLFVLGAIVFSYPFIADSVNNFYDQLSINNYQKEMQTQYKAQEKRRLSEMEISNKALVENNKMTNIPGLGLVADPFEAAVKNTKSPDKSYFQKHMIGAIFIPSIHVSLPIFDETNNDLLEKGATVLQGTSFPIGGKGTHSVITGHTGLPEKKLFTDLEKLKKGDLFYIEVSGKKLAYRVERFKTILPTELDSLKIEDSSDLVTLLTCTPYMINTHRLLVTGVRVGFETKKMTQQIKLTKDYHLYRMFIFASIIPILCFLFAYWIWRKYVSYQCMKHDYNFVFYALVDQKPLVNISFILIEEKGHEIVKKDGMPISAISDQFGRISFKAIPGGKYVAYPKDKTEFPKVYGFVARLNDQIFTIRSKRGKIQRIGNKNARKYLISKR